jgi:hypothetical protein
LEVHRAVANGGWFDDPEVFDFIGRHLFLAVRPSFRVYGTAKSHKDAGLDWRKLTLDSLAAGVDEKTLLVAALQADPQYDRGRAPEKAREDAFRRRGGGTRATYHRRKAQLRERQGEIDAAAVESIRLKPRRTDAHTQELKRRRQEILRCGQESRRAKEPGQPLPADSDGGVAAPADRKAEASISMKAASQATELDEPNRA